nr:hypothetical protein CFP56_29135 [Quercus suber]
MERRTIVQIPSMASLNNEGASPSSSTRRWELCCYKDSLEVLTKSGIKKHSRHNIAKSNQAGVSSRKFDRSQS